MKSLLVIGSNDLAQLISYHALSTGNYSIAGFIDNRKPAGTSIHEFGKVIGPADMVEEAFAKGEFDELVIGVGYNQFEYRKAAFEKFSGKIPFANITHPSAYVDPSCRLGEGIVMLPGCVLDMEVEIGNNVLLNTSVTIAHHSSVQAHSFIAPGVNIAGYVTIGASCFVGIGTTIIDNVLICDHVEIGGASLVLKNVDTPGLYYGHPIKQISKK